MSIEDTKILDTCRTVWEPVLGLSVLHDTTAESVETDETRYGSYVRIKGGWNGAVLVECPQSVARHADAMLFSSDADAATDDDLQHALNELTRLLGHELQKLFPQPTRVSGGKVAADGLQTPRLSEMRQIQGLRISCEGRPVNVTVLERVSEPASP